MIEGVIIGFDFGEKRIKFWIREQMMLVGKLSRLSLPNGSPLH